MQWIPTSEKKEQSDALFDGQVTDVYLIDGHALPPSAIHDALARSKPKQEPVVFFRTDNGWRKEKVEKTLVKKVPLDTTPPTPHVWFDFSNCNSYSSKEEFEKTLLNTVPQREWQSLTDDEIKEIIGSYAGSIKGYTRELFDKIEAKLREKNT